MSTRTNALKLPPDSIAAAQAKGGPTFSPRGRRRFVWNQGKHLGQLTMRQVRTVRSACAPRGTKWEKTEPKPKPVQQRRIREARIDSYNSVECPECYCYHSDVHPGLMNCSACRAQFRVTGERSSSPGYSYASTYRPSLGGRYDRDDFWS